MCAAGCQQQTPAPPANAPTATSANDHGHEHADGTTHEEGHGHGAGPHEGTLADWGGGKYHVEFTVDHDKKEATIYVLGSDEKSPAPVKTADGTLLLTINEPSFQVTLQAAPLDGESDGKSSRYVGTHENLGIVREFAGSISAEVDGTPYAGDFKEEPHGAHDHK
uniref:Uncharacterized protein n=1 Tax=Schlesneria paludicola TaxID=360056 RepID=A0A7C2NXI5_9PLAN